MQHVKGRSQRVKARVNRMNRRKRKSGEDLFLIFFKKIASRAPGESDCLSNESVEMPPGFFSNHLTVELKRFRIRRFRWLFHSTLP